MALQIANVRSAPGAPHALHECQNPLHLLRTRAMHAAAAAAERKERLLSQLECELASAPDLGTVFDHLTQFAVKSLAELCIIDLHARDRGIRRAAVAHSNPEKNQQARILLRESPSPDGIYGVAQVIRTGKAEVMVDAAAVPLSALASGEEAQRFLRHLRVASYMVIPLVSNGRTLGAISLVSASPERSLGINFLMARRVADRAAFAISKAELFCSMQDEKEGRRRSSRAGRSKDLSRIDHSSFTPSAKGLSAPKHHHWATPNPN